jgi:plastocyanin
MAKDPTNHAVTITVDGDGNFNYNPSFVRVVRGDTITFNYDGRFEVAFEDRSPGDKLYLWEGSKTLTISNEAGYGVYHYAVAVLKGDRVFVDPSSGSIGVRD